MMVHVVWVNHRAFRLHWCQKCCFHRPPRTYHCPWCNICVEVSASLICPHMPPYPQYLAWTRRSTYTRASVRHETTLGTAKGQG